jgi:hypothetical protein
LSVFFRSQSKALYNDFDFEKAQLLAWSDWKRDSKGKILMTYADYRHALFELADTW